MATEGHPADEGDPSLQQAANSSAAEAAAQRRTSLEAVFDRGCRDVSPGVLGDSADGVKLHITRPRAGGRCFSARTNCSRDFKGTLVKKDLALTRPDQVSSGRARRGDVQVPRFWKKLQNRSTSHSGPLDFCMWRSSRRPLFEHARGIKFCAGVVHWSGRAQGRPSTRGRAKRCRVSTSVGSGRM